MKALPPADAPVTFRPIGVVQTPFPDKFGVPRQAGLVPSAPAVLTLFPWVGNEHLLRGLEEFSHLWILFLFHHAEPARATIRPPRLGGKKRVGVLASRSPHRPNPIGLSVVKLERVELGSPLRLHLSGVDIVDGSPVLDIKPYLPYADAFPNASHGWAPLPVPDCTVAFSPAAEAVLTGPALHQDWLRGTITELLQLDPRPSSHAQRDGGHYAMRVGGWDVRWVTTGDVAEVIEIVPEELALVTPFVSPVLS